MKDALQGAVGGERPLINLEDNLKKLMAELNTKLKH